MGDDQQLTSPAGLPAGRAVALDDRVRIWRDASVVLGGAPWGIVRIAAAARPFVLRLKDAGAAGLVPASGVERALVDMLLPRGIVYPLPTHDHHPDSAVDVVVPAYDRPDLLDECRAALRT